MEDGIDDTIASTIGDALTWIATTTASAVEEWPTDQGDVPIIGSPAGDMASPDDSEGSYFLNTLIGLIIVLTASVFNALGLNLTKLDHLRQSSIPRRERRPDFMRLLWLSGMGMYIASQVFGSPLALRYLRPDWVAPLGSSALIFNFIFARWLVGTPVTATDIRGTAVIVLGVILIMVFSSINHGLQQSIPMERLNGLWRRGAWLSYFFLIVGLTFVTFLVSHFFERLVASRASYSPLASPTIELAPSRSKPPHPIIGFLKRTWGTWKTFEARVLTRMEITFARADDARLIWLEGIGWAVAGGSLAGLCLVFTKAIVKIFGNPGHPLVHPAAMVTLLLVIATAVCQIICLNKALVCADTVVVVPLFYAGYTVLGFVNSLIFYDESGQYATWILVMVFVSIGVLISGVVLLSLKSSANAAPDPYNTVSAEPTSAMRLNPRSRVVSKQSNVDSEHHDDANADPSSRSPKRDEVMWEVGSDSDNEDDAEKVEGEDGQRRGLGESSGHGRGERRGLLDDDDAERGEAEGVTDAVVDVKKTGDEQDDEAFGDYQAVRRRNSDDQEDRSR